jgi:MoxR-like ATPase
VGSNPEHQRPEPFAPAVRDALARLNRGLVGRDEQAHCLLLSALCSEHVLLIGPPDTAKSELARRLAGVVGGCYLERLPTRFTLPELCDNLWNVPGLADQVPGRLVQGELAMRGLRGMFEGTRAASSAELPLAETDDGRIPEAVSA